MDRTVKAFWGQGEIQPDSEGEKEFARFLAERFPAEARRSFYDRFRDRDSEFDAVMRKIILRTFCKSFGEGVVVSAGVVFKHPETVAIGDRVFLGRGVFVQGRHDGTCRIGSGCWIGPGAYLDARDLVIEENVGFGPGAKVLGSAHTGEPEDLPVIATDLTIKPVRIGQGSDIGVNAIILPGVTIGERAIVGAGAVVTLDVPSRAVVAGVPARLLRMR